MLYGVLPYTSCRCSFSTPQQIMKGKHKRGISLYLPTKESSRRRNADPPASKDPGDNAVEGNDVEERTLTNERDVTPASAWGVMTVLPVELDSRNYDLSYHVASILENQAVSHLERLRCELAARLQQVNQRVDKALHQVGMSRWDVNSEDEDGLGLPPRSERHFAEQRRRDLMLLKIREHSLDSSERTRIMEELYEWFLLTKDYMVIDVKSEKETAMEERAVIKIAASIDSAMMNTLTAIGKIKRLGLKLLISAGYIDQLGRRRQPPKIIEEKMLMADYGKNLDGAIAVVRKCHEELSKIVKSPMLKLWVVSARRQMKNLAVAVVKSYVDHVKLQKSNLEMSKKINKFAGSSNVQEETISSISHQLKQTKKIVDEQKDELRSLGKLLASAHQRGDYLEAQYNKLAAERTFEAQLSGKSILASEVKMVKTALTNTSSVSALDSSAQTDETGSSNMPEGLIMIEKTTLNKLNSELKRLKKKLKETAATQSAESKVNELGVTISNESRSRSQVSLPPTEKKERIVVTRLKEEISRSHNREDDLLQQCRECEKEVENLRKQLIESTDGEKLKEHHMDDLQRQILRGFRNFLPKNWKLANSYEDTRENVESMLKYLMDCMTSLHYDNKRMASYVRDQLDYNFPGAIQRWVDKARKNLNTEAMEEKKELSLLADKYEAKSRIRSGDFRPKRSERDPLQTSHSRLPVSLSKSNFLPFSGQDVMSQKTIQDNKKKVTIHTSLMVQKSATPLADGAKSMPQLDVDETQQELSTLGDVGAKSADEQMMDDKSSTGVGVGHLKKSQSVKGRRVKESSKATSGGGQAKVKSPRKTISQAQTKRSKPVSPLTTSRENLFQALLTKTSNKHQIQPTDLRSETSLVSSQEILIQSPLVASSKNLSQPHVVSSRENHSQYPTTASQENLSLPPSPLKETNKPQIQLNEPKPFSLLITSGENLSQPPLIASQENLSQPSSSLKGTTNQIPTAKTNMSTVEIAKEPVESRGLTTIAATPKEPSLFVDKTESLVISEKVDGQIAVVAGTKVDERQNSPTFQKDVKPGLTPPEYLLMADIQQVDKKSLESSSPSYLEAPKPVEQEVAASEDAMVKEPAMSTKRTKVKSKPSKRESSVDSSTTSHPVKSIKSSGYRAVTKAHSSGGKKRDLSKLFRVGISAVYGQVRKHTRSTTPSPSRLTSVTLVNTSDVPESELGMVRGKALFTVEEADMTQTDTAADVTSADTTAADVTSADISAADVTSIDSTAADSTKAGVPDGFVDIPTALAPSAYVAAAVTLTADASAASAATAHAASAGATMAVASTADVTAKLTAAAIVSNADATAAPSNITAANAPAANTEAALSDLRNSAALARTVHDTTADSTTPNIITANTGAADVKSADTQAAESRTADTSATNVTTADTTSADITTANTVSGKTTTATPTVTIAITGSAFDIVYADTTLTPTVSAPAVASPSQRLNEQTPLGPLRSRRKQSPWNRLPHQMSDVVPRFSLGSIPTAGAQRNDISDQHVTSAEDKRSLSDEDMKLADIEDVWEDLNVDSLPAVNRQLVEVLVSRWNGMKGRVIAYLRQVETRALKSSNSSRNVTYALNEETDKLKLELVSKEDMVRSLQAEKSELSTRLKKAEQNIRHLNQSIAAQTHKQVRKYSYVMEDLDAIKQNYESSQLDLRQMKSELNKLLTTKGELLETIRQQRQQYERISNLHKHLIARLEAYMLKTSMLAEDVKPSRDMLSKEQHSARLARLKYLCRCPDTKVELHKMVKALLDNLRGVGEGQDKMETFVQQYLELPGTKTIEQLEKMEELWKSDDGKATGVLGALSAFNKKLNEQITTVSNKLSTTRQTLMDGRNLYSEEGDIRSRLEGSPEPSAPDGGERNNDRDKSLIQKELLIEAKNLMSFPLRTPSTSQRNRELHKEGTNKTWPDVTGAAFQPTKPSSLWSREKSVLSEKGAFSKRDQELLDQLHTRWMEMDFKTGTKLNNIKGPKHEARLKAVRGYCVDEKTIPLPITAYKAKVHPHCYGIPQCLKGDNPRSSPTQKEKTIVYKTLSFLD